MNASSIFGFFRPSRTDFAALLNAFLNASHWRVIFVRRNNANYPHRRAVNSQLAVSPRDFRDRYKESIGKIKQIEILKKLIDQH